MENLTKFLHIIGDSSSDSHAVLLFNDSLVIARFPLDVPLHPSINPNTVIRVMDLNTIWVFEEESTSKYLNILLINTKYSLIIYTDNNIFVIRTPEQRLQVICMDPVAKSKAMTILNKTINNLVKPRKNKRVDFQFAVRIRC